MKPHRSDEERGYRWQRWLRVIRGFEIAAELRDGRDSVAMVRQPPTIAYTIDTAKQIVYVVTTSEPTTDALQAFLGGACLHPEYRPGFGFLLDRRGAPPATFEYTRVTVALAAQLRNRLAGARLALVVADTASFGAARRAQILFAELPVALEIFCYPSKAETWLRLLNVRPRAPDGRDQADGLWAEPAQRGASTRGIRDPAGPVPAEGVRTESIRGSGFAVQ